MAPRKKSQTARLDSLITAKEKELAKISRYKQTLYEDWKDGEITHSDSRNMREDYERQAEAISRVIDNLKAERDEAEKGGCLVSPNQRQFVVLIKPFPKIKVRNYIQALRQFWR